MPGLQLIIGNKNYSSWSMRPWVLMRQLGIPFEERKLRFDFNEGSDFRRAVAAISPAGKVPVLVDDGFVVWDTLAIAEYLHDRFPELRIWPRDPRDRARARSICAEMHAGFQALRTHCAMNIEAILPDVGVQVWNTQPAVQAEVRRLQAMWSDALQTSGGPFLFGAFCAADAYYAPVCTRLQTYALPLDDGNAAYVQRVLTAPGVADWIDDAKAEHDYLDFEEPYRRHR